MFVGEELSLGLTRYLAGDYKTSIQAFSAGFGLGILAIPKTVVQAVQPNSYSHIMMWFGVSNAGVTNLPSK